MTQLADKNCTVQFCWAGANPLTTKLAKRQKPTEKRLSVTLSHAGDIKRWEELRQNPDHHWMSDAQLIRHALAALHDVDRLASAIDGHEKRLVASLNALHKRLNDIQDSQHVSVAFLEVFMRAYYYHTPSVAQSNKTQAIEEATRRADRFMQDLMQHMVRSQSLEELKAVLQQSWESE